MLKIFVHRLKKQKLMGFDDHFMIYAMVYTCTDSFLSNLLTWWKNKIEMYQTLFWSKGSASSVEVTRDKLIQDETMLQTVWFGCTFSRLVVGISCKSVQLTWIPTWKLENKNSLLFFFFLFIWCMWSFFLSFFFFFFSFLLNWNPMTSFRVIYYN